MDHIPEGIEVSSRSSGRQEFIFAQKLYRFTNPIHTARACTDLVWEIRWNDQRIQHTYLSDGGKIMSLFKRKSKDTGNDVYAFISGNTIPITEVNDPVFSAKTLGDGLAIIPSGELICAPCAGTISMVAEGSNHAVGMTLANGAEILIHVGLDTVSLNGKGFKILVKRGTESKTRNKTFKNLINPLLNQRDLTRHASLFLRIAKTSRMSDSLPGRMLFRTKLLSVVFKINTGMGLLPSFFTIPSPYFPSNFFNASFKFFFFLPRLLRLKLHIKRLSCSGSLSSDNLDVRIPKSLIGSPLHNSRNRSMDV